MAVLTSEERKMLVRAFARRHNATVSHVTAVLETAVQSIEDEIPTVAATLRTAIDVATAPVVLTNSEKNLLIKIVVADRIGVL